MNNRYLASLFILLSLLFASCTKENLEACSGRLRVDFSFTLHTEEGDLFGQNVEVVRVYCFDSEGILRHIQEAPVSELTDRHLMDVELAPGRYQTVAWAGSHSDLSRCYTLLDATLGETTIADLNLQMKGDALSEAPEYISPTQVNMDDLYYGAIGQRHPASSLYTLETINVEANEVAQYPINLIRYTNLLKLTISGIEYLGIDSHFKVWLTAQNGVYQVQNNNYIDKNSLAIKHQPLRTSVTPSTFIADFKLLRLMEDNQPAPILLYIEKPDGGSLFASPINVVTTLQKARDTKTGEYIYDSQSDFDRIYEHHIKIIIGSDLDIRIFIGDWEIVEVVPVS